MDICNCNVVLTGAIYHVCRQTQNKHEDNLVMLHNVKYYNISLLRPLSCILVMYRM